MTLSVVAIDKMVTMVVQQTSRNFSFVVYRENEEPTVYRAQNVDGNTIISKVHKNGLMNIFVRGWHRYKNEDRYF